MSKEFYENGYGVSVVCNEYSYGGIEGLYELAILKGDKDHSEICYETHITNDVIGYLTDTDVENITNQVKRLNKTPEAIAKNRDLKIDKFIENKTNT
jgi:hypothetical protein